MAKKTNTPGTVEPPIVPIDPFADEVATVADLEAMLKAERDKLAALEGRLSGAALASIKVAPGSVARETYKRLKSDISESRVQIETFVDAIAAAAANEQRELDRKRRAARALTSKTSPGSSMSGRRWRRNCKPQSRLRLPHGASSLHSR